MGQFLKLFFPKFLKFFPKSQHFLSSQGVVLSLVFWFVLFGVDSRAFRHLGLRSDRLCRKPPSVGGDLFSIHNQAPQIGGSVTDDRGDQMFHAPLGVCPKIFWVHFLLRGHITYCKNAVLSNDVVQNFHSSIGRQHVVVVRN